MLQKTTKNKRDGMKYEHTAIKQPTDKQVRVAAAKALPRHTLLWLTIKSFKTEILITGNIILVLNWALPSWPQMLLAVLGK